MKSFNFCNNCGKQGHLFHQCNNPITSIGIIVFKNTPNGIKYLLIRRKDTLGYVDFVRGKYPLGNKIYINNIIKEMTETEKNNLLTQSFDTLWKNLWGESIGIQYRGEEKISREKFHILKDGYTLMQNNYSLKSLIDESNKVWSEPEWGFPKGRRNYQEKDIGCAIREFGEETGLNEGKYNMDIVQNINPFEEVFIGSNFKSYKHRYYLAKLIYNEDDEEENNFQKTEVSKMGWYSYEECFKKIRNYNLEKLEVLTRVNTVIQKYNLSV
jgi:ADP-ribose pyrophosphatase YjhB (NUDIX family)